MVASHRIQRRNHIKCTHRVYHHGISHRHFTRHQWIVRGATEKGAYKPRLYKRVHANLDRDDDHIACEN